MLRPHPQVLLADMKDGTAVLLHMGTEIYFALNSTGAALWRALVNGARTPDDLAAALIGVFDVPGEAAARDVAALLAELEARSLVVRG